MKFHAAFTLIELLIVVAILAILASIAVPNFLLAQVRSKVSRAENDLRTLSVAIESFAVDHNAFPRQGPPGSCVVALNGLPELTTPTAYLTTFPSDVFRHDSTGPLSPLCYGVCGGGRSYYYAWSFGPDRENQHGQLRYDSRNGTISPGDILR